MEPPRQAPPACFDPETVYDEAYYRSGLGPAPYQRDDTWLGFFGAVADQLVRTFAPKTVLDVGCAMGMLVESLWDRGVIAEGIDVSAYALSCVRPDMRPHCRYGSIVDGLPGRYDLVTCIEVLEHIPAEHTEAAVRHLCALGDTIVFSSSPVDFDEPTHINVRPPLEWLELFAANGFRAALAVDASFIAPHVLVFRRAESYAAADVDGFVARYVGLRVALADRDKQVALAEAERREARARDDAARAEQDSLLARCAELRADGDANRARCEVLQTALEAAEARAAEAIAEREQLDASAAEARRALQAAQAERDDMHERLRHSTRDRGSLRAEVAALHEMLAKLRADLEDERARTGDAAATAARLDLEVERLRNVRLLDRLQRGEDVTVLQQLRELEARYARLSEAYVARGAG